MLEKKKKFGVCDDEGDDIGTANVVYPNSNSIYIFDMIDPTIALDIASNIKNFCIFREPTKLFVNSHGGNMSSSISIMSNLLSIPSGITVDISGIAYSAAAWISLIGGHVRMSKYASIMFHHPRWWFDGGQQEHETLVTTTKEIAKRIITEGLSLKKRNISTDEFFKKMEHKRDWYLTPKKAKKLGLIDEIY